uniref:Uncharacterized protein n=1 Tax=Timema douglasi TaxID=61478 RepID=A0A7R8Z842_TIMDO|nr:unnamed protein product [Timema douglasi]
MLPSEGHEAHQRMLDLSNNDLEVIGRKALRGIPALKNLPVNWARVGHTILEVNFLGYWRVHSREVQRLQPVGQYWRKSPPPPHPSPSAPLISWDVEWSE